MRGEREREREREMTVIIPSPTNWSDWFDKPVSDVSHPAKR